METAALTAWPDVTETITEAKSEGLKVGLLTTTSAQNINALLDALHPGVSADTFDVVGHDFTQADRVVERVQVKDLVALLPGQ